MGTVKTMARNTSKDAETVTAIKATGRGGKYNFPNAIPPEDPEVVREAASSVLHWYKRGRDSKPQTLEEIQDRIDEYFLECYETGQRMTVEKLALALGIHRDTLHAWETDRATYGEKSDIIKYAKDCIASYDADMVTSGKMNPVPYIFRAKNYYGMKDQQDVVLTPNSPLQTDTNPIDIASKYDTLPED